MAWPFSVQVLFLSCSTLTEIADAGGELFATSATGRTGWVIQHSCGVRGAHSTCVLLGLATGEGRNPGH